jgi:hypothetical protein
MKNELEPDFRWLGTAAGILDIVIRCFVTAGIQLPAGCAEILPCWDAHVYSNRKHAGPSDTWIYLLLEKTVARSTNNRIDKCECSPNYAALCSHHCKRRIPCLQILD